jgi:thioredoxin 1
MQAPILEDLDARVGGKAKICKVDVDEQPAVAGRYGVSSIPTLIVFKDGKPVEKRVGVTSADELEKMLG